MVSPRIVRALTIATLALATLLVLAAPAVAVEHAAVTAPASASADDVDDFSYASWDARYEVGRDDEGRATMRVTETLVARFPEYDQNRGIVRGLATTYQGAGIDTRVISVTDGAGGEVPYETDEDDGTLFVLTGDDDFVQGLTTYVIEYEMRDVVLGASAGTGSRETRGDGSRGGVDEFYWDLLPLDSTQDIESFRAEIRFDAAMSARLTGSSRCYTGASGSTDECALDGPADDDGSAVFRVESGERPAGDGVTVAIGFEPGTVTQPDARRPNPVTDTVPLIAALGATGLSVGAWVAVGAFARRRRRATGIVVAQYDVPGSLPPLLAAALVPKPKNTLAAQIVHLAVGGALRIEEGASPEQPRLRRLDTAAAVDPLDDETLDALFLSADDEGAADIPVESESFATRMQALEKSGAEAAAARGLTTRARSRGAAILQTLAIVVAAAGLALSLWGTISGRLSAVPALVAIAVGGALVLASSLYSFARHTVLTPDGARAGEYLRGVEEFIRVAEADRLRMLQSYTGAERRQDRGVDVIHVYERLLPYAMLFGMEKEWGEVLETHYRAQNRAPGWIGDSGSPFLTSYLTAFAVSSSAAASYSAPSTASSSGSGGSFGGGFSGGGGGGGFSGGR